MLVPGESVAVQAALADLSAQPGVSRAEEELERRRAVPARYDVPPLRMLRLRDAWVETSMCTAIRSDGGFVLDTLRATGQAEECGYRPLAPSRWELPEDLAVDELDGGAMLLGLPVGRNYFHWMFEAVVRWLFVRDHLPEDMPLLVPDVGAMERDALEVVGVPEDRLLVLPARTLLRVGTLVVAPRGLRRSVHIVPAAVRALRAARGRPKGGDERVFISRAGARRRRIANEEELTPVLAAHGFRAVRAEQLTVAEQIDLCGRASVVCGMHGAGLTNAAFAPPGATVVELQPAALGAARTVLYWYVAAAGGQRYAQVLCAEAPGQEERPVAERDIKVAPEHLDEVLRRALPARP